MNRKEKIKRREELLANTKFSRRTLLDWMGKATVLAISGDLITACYSSTYKNSDEDASAHYEDSASGSTERNTFEFEPGEEDLALFKEFRESTVDPQDLVFILNTWKLVVDGLVENPQKFSFTELLELDRKDQFSDFYCIEGWSVLDIPWNGIHLNTFIKLVKPLADATYITFHSIGDIYSESLPVEIAREPMTIIAFGIDKSTLPLAHGFPLRLVIPRMYGYKNAKYIYRIEFTDRPVEGYWEQVGYPYLAPIPDAVLRPGRY